MGNYSNAFAYDGVTSGTTTGPGNPTTFRGVGHSYNADNRDTGNTYDGDGSPLPTAATPAPTTRRGG